MRRSLLLLSGLSALGLASGCGKNQCQPVVERTCVDLRSKAQQSSGSKIPTVDELCEQMKWDDRNPKQPLLAAMCSGEKVQARVAHEHPNTPLKMAEAMCDGMKLHIMTPSVEELTECRQAEDAYEADQERRKEEQKAAANAPKKEEPPPAPKPAAPTSASAPASTPASAETPIPPGGSPSGAPAAPAPK
jgi:hypothetical protein